MGLMALATNILGQRQRDYFFAKRDLQVYIFAYWLTSSSYWAGRDYFWSRRWLHLYWLQQNIRCRRRTNCNTKRSFDQKK